MTQSQLSMLRSQMSGQMIVQAPQTIFQTHPGQNIAIPLSSLQQQGIFLNQQQMQQSQQQQQVKEEQQH